jgi:hypothetical protein
VLERGKVDAPSAPPRRQTTAIRWGAEETYMTLGPLEYTVIGFDGNNFSGQIADEIGRAVESGTIALVDVVFIIRDGAGDVAVVELDNTEDPRFAGFAPLIQDLGGLLTPEDIDLLAVGLPNDSAALVLLFEHRWAVRLKEAMGAAGGFLISRETISPEILEIVNAELESGELSAKALDTPRKERTSCQDEDADRVCSG